MPNPWVILGLVIAFVISNVSADLYGQHTATDRCNAAKFTAQLKSDKADGLANTQTLTHTVSAATHDQAIGAAHDRLQNRIQGFTPAITGGDHVDAPAAASRPVILPSPLADPRFRVFYDAGAAGSGAQGEADHLPAPDAVTASPPPG